MKARTFTFKSRRSKIETMLNDTIIAISTPLGHGGLGVVRLSGSRSLSVAQKIFHPLRGGRIRPRRPILGHLVHPDQKEAFESAYLIYFPAPHTYTCEDLVEISCHGSPVILEEVTRLGIINGARLANPGEFTLRAYLNGRIDLLQAEAVNDLILATSFSQAKISFRQIEGGLSRKMANIRQRTLHLMAELEAGLEFPDENLGITPAHISRALDQTIRPLEALVNSFDLGKSLREGLTLAIAGKPNVGKSTLFNALLEQERAIVSPVPGTTRDYLKERIAIKDSLFMLIDMAGLNDSHDPLETEGIRRSRKLARSADGILMLFDGSRPLEKEDLDLIHRFKEKKGLILLNKIDLPDKLKLNQLRKLSSAHPVLEISALRRTNLERLKSLLHSHFVPEALKGQEIILHLRQKLTLAEVLDILRAAREGIRMGVPEEITAEEIRRTIPLIGRLTGEIRTDDVINDVFSRFCVGK